MLPVNNGVFLQKPVRLTDAMCVEVFQKQFGTNVTVVHMREYQNGVIHACRNAGVLKMPYKSVTIANRQVYYTYCNCCAKVWYYVPEVL